MHQGSLSLSIVQANLSYNTHWRNTAILEHLIFLSLWANIEALHKAVKFMCASVLPFKHSSQSQVQAH